MLRTLATAVALLAASASAAEPYALVRNAQNPVPALSKEQLRRALTGKLKTWEQGGSVEVILRSGDTAEFSALAERVYGLSGANLRATIQKEAFRGEVALVTVATEREAIEALKGRPGGLALVSAQTAKELPAYAVPLKVLLAPLDEAKVKVTPPKLRMVLLRNAANAVDSVTTSSLASLLDGSMAAWPSGTPATLYLLRGETAELKFLATVVTKTEVGALDRKLSTPPDSRRPTVYRVDDPAAAMRYVQCDPGAMALLGLSEVGDAVPADLDFMRLTR